MKHGSMLSGRSMNEEKEIEKRQTLNMKRMVGNHELLLCILNYPLPEAGQLQLVPRK
jgi:hypothetical protein